MKPSFWNREPFFFKCYFLPKRFMKIYSKTWLSLNQPLREELLVTYTSGKDLSELACQGRSYLDLLVKKDFSWPRYLSGKDLSHCLHLSGLSLVWSFWTWRRRSVFRPQVVGHSSHWYTGFSPMSIVAFLILIAQLIILQVKFQFALCYESSVSYFKNI